MSHTAIKTKMHGYVLWLALVQSLVLPHIWSMPARASLTCENLFSASVNGARSPGELVTHLLPARVNETMNLLKNKSLMAAPENLRIRIAPKRKSFFDVLYNSGLVEAGDLSRNLADKLVHARVLKEILGEDFARFHPETYGLCEFLLKEGVVDPSGRLLKTQSEIEALLRRRFPVGLVIKATEGEGSHGLNLVHDAATAARLIASGDSALWAAKDLTTPFIGPISGVVGSGERFLIMEVIPYTGFADPNSPYAKTNEFRVHIFDGQVVHGASFQRYRNATTPEKIAHVEGAVQAFYDRMPIAYKNLQAHSWDVFLLPSGEIRIIEINTNSGRRRTWSGFTRYPEVMAAHANLIEARYNWFFEGIEGQLIRGGLANIKNAIGVRALSIMGDFDNGAISAEDMLARLRTGERAYGEKLEAYIRSGKPTTSDLESALTAARRYRQLLDAVEHVGDQNWETFKKWLTTEFSENNEIAPLPQRDRES